MQKSKSKKVTKKKKIQETPTKLQFDYLKSNQHREILVEGVHGGITPKGRIQMSVFCERQPIPRQITHEFNENQLGPEILSERLSRDSIIRSVDATLIMDLETAKVIREWLDAKIKEGEDIIDTFEEKRKK